MLKRIWAALLTGMATTLGAIVVTKASEAIDQSNVKDWLKNKFDNLKNRIHRKKDEP